MTGDKSAPAIGVSHWQKRGASSGPDRMRAVGPLQRAEKWIPFRILSPLMWACTHESSDDEKISTKHGRPYRPMLHLSSNRPLVISLRMAMGHEVPKFGGNLFSLLCWLCEYNGIGSFQNVHQLIIGIVSKGHIIMCLHIKRYRVKTRGPN